MATVESFIGLPADGAGKKTRTLEETVGANVVHTEYIVHRAQPSFTVFQEGVVPAANKYMLAILNRNTAKVVRVWRIWGYISSTAAVTGVLLQFRLGRITSTVALSGGTSITPAVHDTNEAFPASIDVMTGPTNAITYVSSIRRCSMSGDEAVVSTDDADMKAFQELVRDDKVIFKAYSPFVKPITLRTNGTTHEGFGFQQSVGTVGNLGIICEFTVDDV